MALVRMRESYEDVEKVLVLDGYLLQENCKDMPTYEIVLRIFCSLWNRRLWTLQKGVLARELVFQFRDMFADTALLDEARATEDTLTKLDQVLFSSTQRSLNALRASKEGVDKRMNVLEAKQALTYRSTSNPADEPLCLGNLLGIDPTAVVQATSRNERMKVIWKALPQHFSEPLFWVGPKIKDIGYRWAAATLMHEGLADYSMEADSPANTRPAGPLPGLCVRLPAIQFYLPCLKVGDIFRFYIGTQGPYTGFWNTQDISECPKGTIFAPSTRRGFMILLGPRMEGTLGTEGLVEESSCSLGLSGKLADIVGDEENITRVHLLNKVNFYRMAILTDSTLNLDAPEAEWKARRDRPLKLEHSAADQAGKHTTPEISLTADDYTDDWVSDGIPYPEVLLIVD